MKEKRGKIKSELEKNDGVNRRGFIARMFLLAAGLAAGSLSWGASQNQASAQTGKRVDT